jgi:hypothetical protein
MIEEMLKMLFAGAMATTLTATESALKSPKAAETETGTGTGTETETPVAAAPA